MGCTPVGEIGRSRWRAGCTRSRSSFENTGSDGLAVSRGLGAAQAGDPAAALFHEPAKKWGVSTFRHWSRRDDPNEGRKFAKAAWAAPGVTPAALRVLRPRVLRVLFPGTLGCQNLITPADGESVERDRGPTIDEPLKDRIMSAAGGADPGTTRDLVSGERCGGPRCDTGRRETHALAGGRGRPSRVAASGGTRCRKAFAGRAEPVDRRVRRRARRVRTDRFNSGRRTHLSARKESHRPIGAWRSPGPAAGREARRRGRGKSESPRSR